MARGQTVVWPAVGGPGTGWLWNRRADLFWIAGGGFFLTAAVLTPLSLLPGAGVWITSLFLHLAIVCNYPHYAATYQLIVRERHGKPGPFFWLLVSTPLMIGLLLVAGFHHELVWAPVMRLYLTWSAHHYAAQNYGLAALYSMRFGQGLTDGEKRPLQAAFLGLGAVMMICANTLGGDATLAARIVGVDRNAEYIPIAAFPPWAYHAAMLLAIASFGAFLWARQKVVARTGKGFRPAVWLLFATTAAWFVLPNVRMPGGGTWMWPSLTLALFGAPPFFHCAQYLGITGHRSRWTGDVKPIWLFAMLVGVGYLLFHGPVPLLKAVLPLDSAHAILLLLAVINLHHFWMDGLMWRRPKKAPAPAPAPAPAAT